MDHRIESMFIFCLGTADRYGIPVARNATMLVSEYACIFRRPSPEHLGVAAQFVGTIPALLNGADGELDVYHCLASGYTAAVVRASAEVFTSAALARLGFWSARARVRWLSLDTLSDDERARVSADLSACDRVLKGTRLEHVQQDTERFFRGIGVVSFGHPTGARMVVAMDIDGPGAEGISYAPATRMLFVPGVLAPPPGDQLVISARQSASARPVVDGWATVVEVRRKEDAAPGRPAGFTLRIEGPPRLHDTLADRLRIPVDTETRAAPRYAVRAPFKVKRVAATDAHTRADEVQTIPGRIERANEELAHDWIENLSQGGAFVRTTTPHPEGSELFFELGLPDGARLEGNAVVAFVNDRGMGLRFVLSAEQNMLLSAVIARISARPKRALLVDDDALSRQLLTDALCERGFEVFAAADANSGLHILTDELLALDLFVTDLVMPGLGGEALIRMIREAGGESELAIVAVTGRFTRVVERALEAAGADAVLDKGVGPAAIVQAADAVLERRRRAQREDAA